MEAYVKQSYSWQCIVDAASGRCNVLSKGLEETLWPGKEQTSPQLYLAENLLPALTKGQCFEMVKQLATGRERLVRFSSVLETAGHVSFSAKRTASELNVSPACLPECNGTKSKAELADTLQLCELSDCVVTPAEPHSRACSAGKRLQVEVEMEMLGGTLCTDSLHEEAKSVSLTPRTLLVRFSPVANRIMELEAQVRALEQNFQYTMDLLPEVAFTKDAQGRYLMANRAMCDLLQKRREDIIGHSFRETCDQLHFQELVDSLEHDDRAVLETGEACYFPDLYIQASTKQSGRWFRHVKSPYQTVDGKQAIFGFATDITELKGALMKAHASEAELLEKQRLQLMVDNINVGALQVDRSGDHADPPVYINKAMERLVGYSQDEVPSLSAWFKLLHRDEDGSLLAAYEERMKSASSRPTPPVRFSELYRKDGSKRLLECGGGTHATGEVWVVHDVTERHSATEKFETIFHLASDPYYIYSESGILECNAAAVEILGFESKMDVVGRFIAEISPEFQPDGQRSVDKAAALMDATRRTKKVVRFEWEHVRTDGTLIPVEVAIKTLELEGRQVFISIWHDLTERKAAEAALRAAKEEAEAANQAKSQFLSNCSHEIRTPMNGVIGVAELLLDTQLSAEQRGFVETIRSSGDHLLKLINDILDLAKIEASNLQLEALPFGLREEVHQALALLDRGARDKGLTLSFSVETAVPNMVVGDPMRLRQILLNLLSNALKFTHRGRIEVDIRVAEEGATSSGERSANGGEPEQGGEGPRSSGSETGIGSSGTENGSWGHGMGRSEDGAKGSGDDEGAVMMTQSECQAESEAGSVMVQFEVRDTGVGIPAEAQERIFKAFMQADSSTSRRYGGTGLGLCICQSLVQAMGGRIWLQSTLEQGTSFFFTIRLGVLEMHQAADAQLAQMEVAPSGSWSPPRLPLPAKLPVAASPSPPPPLPKSSFANLHVLVAEDNSVNQMVATRILRSLGCAFHVVDDGRKAVAACATGNYDVILMDCHMPDIDGYEATRQIREQERKQGRRHLIIALTASALEDDAQRCLRAGMDSFLSKPVRPNDVKAAIQAHLAVADAVRLVSPTSPLDQGHDDR